MEIKRAAQKNKFVQLLFIEMLITYALKANEGIFSLLRECCFYGLYFDTVGFVHKNIGLSLNVAHKTCRCSVLKN